MSLYQWALSLRSGVLGEAHDEVVFIFVADERGVARVPGVFPRLIELAQGAVRRGGAAGVLQLALGLEQRLVVVINIALGDGYLLVGDRFELVPLGNGFAQFFLSAATVVLSPESFAPKFISAC